MRKKFDIRNILSQNISGEEAGAEAGAFVEVAGEEHGGEEVDGGEEPHHGVAVAFAGEGGAVGVEAHEAFKGPDVGDGIATQFPEAAHGIARPCESRQEEEYHRGKHHDHKAALTLLDKRSERHAEEGGAEEQGKDEDEVVDGVAIVGQAEYRRHYVENVDGQWDVEHHIAESLAKHRG